MTYRKRVQLEIDLMGIDMQVAQVLPGVTVTQLIQEILVEFGLEYAFLNQHKPEDYVLRTTANGYELPSDQQIQQIGNRTSLFFREATKAIPEKAIATATPFYLRYRSHVFKIAWQPSIIGRPMPGAAHDTLLAVDLEPFSLAVSRRQAEIVVENGCYAIRRLNENPVLLNDSILPFSDDKVDLLPAVPLKDGDEILLQRSGIRLTCLQPSILAPNREEIDLRGATE